MTLFKAERANAKPGEIRYYYAGQFQFPSGIKTVVFPRSISKKLLQVLTDLMGTKKRVRVYYGDSTTGECLGELSRHPNGRFNLEDNYEVWEGYLDYANFDNCLMNIQDAENDMFYSSKHQKVHLPALRVRDDHMSLITGLCTVYIMDIARIVRIEYSNKKFGQILWKHPRFHCY